MIHACCPASVLRTLFFSGEVARRATAVGGIGTATLSRPRPTGVRAVQTPHFVRSGTTAERTVLRAMRISSRYAANDAVEIPTRSGPPTDRRHGTLIAP